MAVDVNDFKVTRDHDYPSFLEIQVKKKQKYIETVETENKYLKRDRWNGWFAASLLLGILALALYQSATTEVLVCAIPK